VAISWTMKERENGGARILVSALALALAGCATSSHASQRLTGSAPPSTLQSRSTVESGIAAPQTSIELPFLRGSGNYTTEPFKVPARWTLQRSYDCRTPRAFSLTVVHPDGTPVAGDLAVNFTSGTQGARIYVERTGGTVMLRIATECDWTVEALSK
jgi:hypothetical protein